MKDESRIDALEHELKILKNEIQSTLLEIREQILNHYYPELRAEEPLRTHSLPVRPMPTRPGLPAKTNPPAAPSLSEIEAKGQIQPFSDIFLEDLTDEDLTDEDLTDEDNEEITNTFINSRQAKSVDEDLDGELGDELGDELYGEPGQGVTPASKNRFGVTPQTREVDYRQLKQAAANATSTPKAMPVPEAVGSKKASRQTLPVLATWVGNAIATAGKKRTSQIVETYASGDKLSGETKNSLMQLISLASDDEPSTPATSHDMLALMVSLDEILEQ